MILSNIFSLAAALALVTADPGYLALPIKKTNLTTTSKTVVKNSKVKFVPEALKNRVYSYLASYTIGDQPEQHSLIDTGSSDLWVYSASSGAPGGYNPSGATFVNNDFSIQYVDGSGAQGSYYKDHLKWGASDVTAEFAVVGNYPQDSTENVGVFGIGLTSQEATYTPYNNYPLSLKDQGVIESTAYSLYLNNLDAAEGTIVFGAVDTSRFVGELKQIPLAKEDQGFWVNFDVAGHSITGVLDSGTSLTYLPDDVASKIALSLGATWDDDQQSWVAPSTIPETGVTYSFAGKEITVPPSELWIHEDSTNTKYLSILPSSQTSGYVLLGDTFLRSAYVVYDLDSKTLAVGQANLNPGPANYEVITPNGIPHSY